MKLNFRVKHSKNLATIGKRGCIIAALFEITPITKTITTQWELIGNLQDFIWQIKEKISYQEAKAYERYNIVFEISFDYEYGAKTRNYAMETLLLGVYHLGDKEIEELGTDLFIALSDKWLEFYNEDKAC